MSNLHTHEQAITKVCPMNKEHCVGTECMLWTTYYRETPQVSKSEFPVPPKYEATDKGYCGLSK